MEKAIADIISEDIDSEAFSTFVKSVKFDITLTKNTTNKHIISSLKRSERQLRQLRKQMNRGYSGVGMLLQRRPVRVNLFWKKQS
jgi:hypothetical protein